MRASPARVGFPSPAEIDATWTSGRRTPEGNKLVGGGPNSMHLTGEAADFVPRDGQDWAGLAAELRSKLPGARLLREKDHYHVEQRGWGVPYHGKRGVFGMRGR